MGGPIDMEWKGCESIRCYTHFVTSTLTLIMTLTLDFQGQNLKVHGKLIGQVMGQCETLTVSNLLANEWVIRSLI